MDKRVLCEKKISSPGTACAILGPPIPSTVRWFLVSQTRHPVGWANHYLVLHANPLPDSRNWKGLVKCLYTFRTPLQNLEERTLRV